MPPVRKIRRLDGDARIDGGDIPRGTVFTHNHVTAMKAQGRINPHGLCEPVVLLESRLMGDHD